MYDFGVPKGAEKIPKYENAILSRPGSGLENYVENLVKRGQFFDVKSQEKQLRFFFFLKIGQFGKKRKNKSQMAPKMGPNSPHNFRSASKRGGPKKGTNTRGSQKSVFFIFGASEGST